MNPEDEIEQLKTHLRKCEEERDLLHDMLNNLVAERLADEMGIESEQG